MNKSSFEAVYYWMSEIDNNTGPEIAANWCLIGNKADLEAQSEREVLQDSGKSFFNDHRTRYFETSSYWDNA